MATRTRWRTRLRAGLAVKLAALLVVSTAALFTLFGYWNLRHQRQQAEELVLQSADRISDLIQRSTRYQMLRNDREALYQVISTIGREPGIRRIRIFNEEGRISFSTDPSEVNTLVDKRAEACYACHVQAAPLTKLARPDRARIFTDPRGERVLGLIRPIENEPACANAACHAHPAERRILGVIDTDLSLAAVDQQLAENQAQARRFTVLAVVLMSLGSVLFVWWVVHRPVKELIRGTHEMAQGNLDHRLPVRSRDELGELAASFNKMAADLSTAYQEITDWAHTLEQRVERKTAELQRAHTQLVASEKMAALGKLAATVAHEVNNPLSGILTYARLSLKNLSGDELKPVERAEMVEHLRIIERESRRCGEIMRNLLTFARQAPPQRAPSDLNTLLQRALTLVQHQLELQGIELETRLGEALPPLACDAGQMQQVILALLVNAAEAMPRGGRLEVSTEIAGSDSLRIRVRDTGVGIPADLLPHVFEPFFTTKENQQRAGLGLAVARSIVEQHGGTIAVSSTPGEGTEFVVSLPLVPPEGSLAGTGVQAEARGETR
ncbi:MAG: HAMP domain-containing protein [Acidobacteria bacterium]|nr:HAMP domain-containing protein [Acidobacteriota bacterium]